MASGSRHSLALVAETVYGTTPANPAFKKFRHTGLSVGLSKETLQSEELRDDRMIASVRGGAEQVAGDIEFELSYGSFDDYLQAVLCGTWEVGGGGTGVDRLKAGVTRRSFTAERNFGDIQSADKPFHRFTGVEFNTLELAVNANAIVTGTFGVVGRGMSTATTALTGATYAAASTTDVFDSFSGELIENGTTIGVITEVQLSLDNGIEPRFVVGSRQTIRPSIGRSNLSGNITAYFENSVLLDKFLSETASSMELELTDPAGNLMRIVVPRLRYNGGQPDVEGEGDITLSMPFQALLDPVTGTNVYIERDPA